MSYLELIEKWAAFVIPKEKIDICPHDSDSRFLEAAAASKASFIISGDKYLLKFKKI